MKTYKCKETTIACSSFIQHVPQERVCRDATQQRYEYMQIKALTRVSNNPIIIVCIYFSGNAITVPLPSNDTGIQIQTHRLKIFIKYAVKMGLRIMIILIKISTGVQNFVGEIHIHRHQCCHISLLFENL
jgi:hypothetical protein